MATETVKELIVVGGLEEKLIVKADKKVKE